MKFRFLQGSTKQYGYDFVEGEFTEVEDSFALMKLSGNQFFEKEFDEPSAEVENPQPPEERPSFTGTIFKRKPGRPPKS
jgi:hypothetical protein